jgi:hypothetical protein
MGHHTPGPMSADVSTAAQARIQGSLILSNKGIFWSLYMNTVLILMQELIIYTHTEFIYMYSVLSCTTFINAK